MRKKNPGSLRRWAAVSGLGAAAMLAATALHTGVPASTPVELQAKGAPTGLATASVAPTMRLGQTLGHSAPTTTTAPGQ